MAQAAVLVARLRTPWKGLLVSAPPRKRKAASYLCEQPRRRGALASGCPGVETAP